MTVRKQKKICIIATVDYTLDSMFPGFYNLLLSENYSVTAICAETFDGIYSEELRKQGIKVINVPMNRDFSILQDLKCLWKLYNIFRREKFDLIHYSTPKASILAAIAGRLAGGSFLLYTLRGLGYLTVNGIKRVIAKLCERVACCSAHKIIVISKSLKSEAIKEKLLSDQKAEVHGLGSSKGVNIEQFNLDNKVIEDAKKIRQELSIGKDDIVIGYAGRLTEEKGVKELVNAFCELSKKFNDLHLMLIGDQDQRNPLNEDVLVKIKEFNSIHQIDFTNEFSSYLAALDIFVLPSHRDGFGNVIIEASAMQIPVIATDIPGCRDTLVDGITGLLVKHKDTYSLRMAMERLVENPLERKEFGDKGCEWVRKNFDRNIVWERLIGTYGEILSDFKG